MMKINLTQGKQAIVDDDIYDELSTWKWQAMKHSDQKSYYVGRRRLKNDMNKPKTIKLHRVIWELKKNTKIPSDMEIDHINGDPLDNTLSNMRLSTHSENCKNAKKQQNVSSVYKGVTRYRHENKWTAQIRVNYKKIHLGYFENEIDATIKYDEAARKYFGEYAKLNFGGN